MKPIHHLIRLTGCLAIAASFAVVLIACPQTQGVRVTQDVPYGVGYVSDSATSQNWSLKTLLLDVYDMPDSNGAAKPAVLLVHGGSFESGSKDKEEIVALANHFTRNGYVCFSMDYRLRDDFPPAPSYWGAVALSSAAHAAIVDTKAALRFIQAQADTYGVDPNRVALVGESAGAIAGVAAAVSEPDDYASDGEDFPIPQDNHPDQTPRVDAYVHLWGSADHVLLKIGRNDPPTMIVHGTEDDNFFTPFGAAERFHAMLELWGIPHEFYAAEGKDHGVWEYRSDGKALRQLILEFMNEHLPDA